MGNGKTTKDVVSAVRRETALLKSAGIALRIHEPSYNETRPFSKWRNVIKIPWTRSVPKFPIVAISTCESAHTSAETVCLGCGFQPPKMAANSLCSTVYRRPHEEMRWVRPVLVAQIEFLEWTEGDHLRHAKFVRLRDDKDARAAVKEYAGEA